MKKDEFDDGDGANMWLHHIMKISLFLSKKPELSQKLLCFVQTINLDLQIKEGML